MKTSPSDEDLLLYYYEEGLSSRERADILALLQRDPQIGKRYEQLSTFLQGLRDDPVDTANERQHALWHAAIDRVGRAGHARRGMLHVPSFAWGIAAVLLVAIGVAIGFALRTPTSGTMPDDWQVGVPTQQPYAYQATFTRGLRQHLRESQLGVLELDAQSSDARQALALQIVRQNRLFEHTAKRHDAEELARLLRAFEPVLLELSAPDTSDARAERLKNQLDFELGVVLTKLAPTNSTDTETI